MSRTLHEDSQRTKVVLYPHEKRRELLASISRYKVQTFTKKGPACFGFDTLADAVRASLKYEFAKIWKGQKCLAAQSHGKFNCQNSEIQQINVLNLRGV